MRTCNDKAASKTWELDKQDTIKSWQAHSTKKCTLKYTHLLYVTLSPSKRHSHEDRKIIKKFLWKEDENKRKLHSVGWDKVCKSGEAGCLGVKDLVNELCTVMQIAVEVCKF